MSSAFDRRLRLRFGLRSLITVVVAFAVMFALVGGRIRESERQRYVLRELQRLGADEWNVWYADERQGDGWRPEPLGIEGVYGLSPSWRFAYFRQIGCISLSAIDIPEPLIDEIAGLPSLQEFRVPARVARRPAFQRLRQLRPDVEVGVNWSAADLPYQEVESVAELRTATTSGRALLIIDATWNIEAAQFLPEAAAFYDLWHTSHPNEPITWLRTSFKSTDELDEVAFREWLQGNGLGLGGLKQMGACRVIWFEDGQIKDAAWYAELTSQEILLRRTRTAFGLAVGDDG